MAKKAAKKAEKKTSAKTAKKSTPKMKVATKKRRRGSRRGVNKGRWTASSEQRAILLFALVFEPVIKAWKKKKKQGVKK